jgi:hypothetical protein
MWEHQSLWVSLPPIDWKQKEKKKDDGDTSRRTGPFREEREQLEESHHSKQIK